ncbi:uncharacterized protein I303_103029 [Kwoniella dejecticola CBS 10117]|uniref:Uncharacterized protein n=1 Tax=Kwoniella dejecticola CBS 10117 TaxID=1296121 RepID=A0A1A6AAD6_9TREE|nr:uncharacterized protein I303_03049 [Kwoniella dejecticola CBS 10117]OBR87027.1 hypothetical protein I303_03049 [Kwoniella dejecticola CBS 10117]
MVQPDMPTTPTDKAKKNWCPGCRLATPTEIDRWGIKAYRAYPEDPKATYGNGTTYKKFTEGLKRRHGVAVKEDIGNGVTIIHARIRYVTAKRPKDEEKTREFGQAQVYDRYRMYDLHHFTEKGKKRIFDSTDSLQTAQEHKQESKRQLRRRQDESLELENSITSLQRADRRPAVLVDRLRPKTAQELAAASRSYVRSRTKYTSKVTVHKQTSQPIAVLSSPARKSPTEVTSTAEPVDEAAMNQIDLGPGRPKEGSAGLLRLIDMYTDEQSRRKQLESELENAKHQLKLEKEKNRNLVHEVKRQIRGLEQTVRNFR